MKYFVLAAWLLLVSVPIAYASGSHHVRGYITKNGTYVSPHWQTNPNGTTLDNWSHKGNYNPYTGKSGWKN
jgi:hypothetical protein